MQRVDIDDCKDQLRVPDPRINFVVSKFGLPRLLVEVDSSRYTSWRLVRLLLEGAAIVRFANTFLEAFRRAKNFVLCAVIILSNGEVIRYTLYQEQDHPRVCYKEKRLSLNKSIDRIDFVRQLYNLIHMEREDEHCKDTIKKTSELKRAIFVHRLKSFSSPDMDTDKFTDYEEADQRDRTGDDEHAADYAELRAHGYEAEPRVIVDDSGGRREQFYQTPSHIHTVYRPPDPINKLIAKKTREKSNEVEILKLLNVAQPKSDHIIWLIDSFQGQSKEWAILPKLQSVADTVESAPEMLESEVVQVCLDLIKGLAYLHKLCIAHRDIKPDNLLLDRDFCLKIIGFDIAIQVKDEDEEVDDRCGTMGWVAPEIEMKRKVMYSPIKADRWSCGHVLLWILNKLGKDEMPLRAIARKLNAYTPKRRPSLVECCNPSSQLLLDDNNIWDADKRKPSGSRDRQDSMEVDEEDTMPPNAKKQKLL
ncbi:kinase-like domain-containing protein [Russula dissimulans]|nr:kinase-like domain-containing protein [Russula dissimulans]